MKYLFVLLTTFSSLISYAQKDNVATSYTISFENAVHHEAQVAVVFSNVKNNEVTFRMSRASPGRYAIHEFAKNVYNVAVTDGKGNTLNTTRPDPYSWKVTGHDGTIQVSYTLFANRGGGTYTQIDETHAHLNMPATFMYMPTLAGKGMQVIFNTRKDLNWKVATQLKPLGNNTYYAKDLQYFMDSPTEISSHSIRSFTVDKQTINFVLHHNGTEAELDTYFEDVKKVVLQQKKVFGKLPNYDYDNYYFLACYIPNASGDGMEHRNSTILTSTRSLADGGLKRNMGTVSHEFFHGWNVERIRPQSLEPFDFEAANMSGELWFAEGFTSYYTSLMMCRAGLLTKEEYVQGLTRTFNYVWNSPARAFFNPIEMSYQAPFVDAATAVDPVNRNNTFISYYSYGSALGLALDLSLREKGLNLDDYMKLVWQKHGKKEKPYTVEDLHNLLKKYAGDTFGDFFFQNYIYKSNMPDMHRLFESMGISLTQDESKASFGVPIVNGTINRNTTIGTAAYEAGLEKGDKIIKVNNKPITNDYPFKDIITSLSPNDILNITYERYGVIKEATATLQKDPSYTIKLNDATSNKAIVKRRNLWLDAK
ncbi:PDZ domain-containing protein [uncultured Dokdonia sp.]|uniref:M61 family metallopeptidase n=1 Tax=uncultured Dokdonia sp. TaxID=575653 RepID=UPI00261ABE54|nr:PDZ domain-containing protein [uncultured Dokdonia sp.]